MEHFAEALPGSPFAYWIERGCTGRFRDFPTVEGDSRNVRVGLQTSDDFLVLRAIWEVPTVGLASEVVFRMQKAANYHPFMRRCTWPLTGAIDGRGMKASADPLYDNSGWSRIIKSTEFYFHPGLTWPRRASRFAPRPMPAGPVFTVRGFSVFLPGGETSCGRLRFSTAAGSGSSSKLSTRSLRISRTSLSEHCKDPPGRRHRTLNQKRLADLAIEAWRNARDLDSMSNTWQAFDLPSVLRNLSINDISHRIGEILSEIDAIGFNIFILVNLDEARN